jgi:hypothetical protein
MAELAALKLEGIDQFDTGAVQVLIRCVSPGQAGGHWRWPPTENLPRAEGAARSSAPTPGQALS